MQARNRLFPFQTLEEAVLLDFFCMCRNVAPNNVSLVGLKVPRGYQHQVIVPDPHPSLYLAANPARSDLAVSALDNDIIAAYQLYHSPEKLALTRHHHFLQG